MMEILLIEDNADHAELFQYAVEHALEKGSFTIEWQSDLTNGLSALESKPFDFLFLDLNLPDCNLHDTLSNTQKQNPRNTPIIVMTSLDDAELAQKLISQGACYCLHKESLNPEVIGQILNIPDTPATNRKRNILPKKATPLDSDLIRKISHDFKMYLRNISGMAKLLQEESGGNYPREIEEHLENNVQNCNMLRQMVDDLREVATLQGTTVSESAPHSLPHSIDELINSSLSHSIQQREATLICENLPELSVSDEVISIFSELIDNALKFQSEAKPVIKIQAKEEPTHWHFSVVDNGRGISLPADRINLIFDIFHRLPPYLVDAGTGTGLYLCKLRLEKLGGRLFATSNETGGSTLSFTLPKN